MTLGRAIKAAFLNKWNLLAFGAGLAFGALSGPAAVVVLPLVLAAEIAYLGFLGTHPKFQKYLDAQAAKATRQQGGVSAELTMRRILEALPDKMVRRFEGLRGRCRELRQLAHEMRGTHAPNEPQPLESMQLAGLDRLLWIYLRLLFTQYSLERFQRATSPDMIQGDIENLQERLRAIPAQTADPQQQKLRKVLEDNLETSQARLANCRRAQDNYELVQVELERLENKISTLSELAVNRHEPDFIAGQVEQVADSMVQTERTMTDLQFVTGLEPLDEQVPEMLRRETVPTRR